MLEVPFVETELASLAEAKEAAGVITLEGLFVVVNIDVLLQILSKREPFVALRALKIPLSHVSRRVAAQGEAGSVLLAAVLSTAGKRL